MIYVKSFSGTELIAKHFNTREAVKKAVEDTTEEVQCWIEKEEDFAEKHFKDGYAKVLSTSTQLAVTEDIASYVITVVIDQDGKDEE